MKNKYLLFIMVLMIKSVYSADFNAVCSSGQTLYYNFNALEDYTVTVTYPGTSNNSYYLGYTKPVGEIVFPSTVTYGGVIYTVTGIGDFAFVECGDVTGISLPNTIDELGYHAFRLCGIRMLIVPETVSHIGGGCFSGNPLVSISVSNPNTIMEAEAFIGTTWYNSQPDGLVYIGSILCGYKGIMPANSTITLANNTTSIASRTFKDKQNMVSIVFPNTLRIIGSEAFYACGGLSSVTIPQSVVSIGKKAFENCGGLTTVHFNAITCVGSSVEYGAFRGCEHFTELIIGNGVQVIPASLFSECHLSGGLIIPPSVTSIGYKAFYGCNNITSVIIPQNVEEIGWGAFGECNGLVSVSYNAVDCEYIGSESPFYPCNSIVNFSIGNSVQRIPKCLFKNCTGVTGSLVLPSSITTIEEGAFINCSGITALTLGSNVSYVGSNAFDGMSNLVSVNYNPINLTCESGLFSLSSIRDLNIGQGVQSIPNEFAYGCCNLRDPVLFPSSLLTIGDNAFWNCTSITNLVLPNSVVSIGTAAFNDCTGINALEIGDGVETIGDYAFSGCSGVSEIVIPNSVRMIGEMAFSGCSGAIALTIGTNVETIVPGAFMGLSNLKKVVYNARNVSCENLGLFNNSNITNLTIGQMVQSIPNYFMMSCPNLLGNLMLPSSIERIGDYAFSNCGFSGELVLPENVQGIGNNAFIGCAFISIKSMNRIPPFFDNGEMAFLGYWDKPLYVPQGCVNAYSSAVGWRNFINIQEIGTGVVEWDEVCNSIRIVNGQIIVDCASDVPVGLYDVTGRCLELKTGSITNAFSVIVSGIYVLKIGEKAYKVAVSR